MKTSTAYDPADHIAHAFPDIAIRHVPTLPFGVFGYTDWPTRTITLTSLLGRAEERSTLAHEVVHLERGPAGDGDEEVEEYLVDLVAASRLVAPRDLMQLETRLESESEERVAHSLGIDEGMLATARALASAVQSLIEQRESASEVSA